VEADAAPWEKIFSGVDPDGGGRKNP
jgi:hypothetical protein